MDDPGVSIAVVSELIEVPVPTIRSWERRYRLPPPTRTRGGHRRYTKAQIARLSALRDEIARGHRAAVAAERIRLTGRDRVSGGEGLVERLLAAADAWDAEAARVALEDATQQVGVERALDAVVFPALREIGERWKVGRCDVGQEHIVTGEVRAWLMRHRTLGPAAFRSGGPIVLASGPNAQHSVPLEAFALVLARRGWPVRTLGARTPIPTLVEAVRALEAAGVVLACQYTGVRRDAVDAIETLHRLRRGPVVFFAGAAFTASRARAGVPGVYLGEDLLEAAALLENTLRERGRALA